MENLAVINIDQHLKFIHEREGDTLPKVYVIEILEQIRTYAKGKCDYPLHNRQVKDSGIGKCKKCDGTEII